MNTQITFSHFSIQNKYIKVVLQTFLNKSKIYNKNLYLKTDVITSITLLMKV